MNHRRGHSRKQVRCRLCTDNRDYIGSDRQQRKRDGAASDSQRVSNGEFWDFCPDCNGSGRCDCPGCKGETCDLCEGTRIYSFIKPRA